MKKRTRTQGIPKHDYVPLFGRAYEANPSSSVAPLFRGDFTWNELEAALGVSLPQDYKALIETYGKGFFANYLGLYMPFEHAAPDGFIQQITLFSGNIHDRKEFPEDTIPFDLYPYEPLVPLGFTDDMGLVCWRSRNDSDVIITIDADISPNYGEYNKSLSQFIYEWVTGVFVPYGFDNAEEISPKSVFNLDLTYR